MTNSINALEQLWQEHFGVSRDQGLALISARSHLADDLERALGFWARPECEDGGRPADHPPFGWGALCDRLETLEELERTFPRVFSEQDAQDFAEAC